MGELVALVIMLLFCCMAAKIAWVMFGLLYGRRRLRVGPFTYRPARRRGFATGGEVQARRDRVIHDTWGKVSPGCQCEGCRNERCYVESRNMWTAAIMRGTHDATSEELDARYTASKPAIRTAPGRIAFTPLFESPISGPCSGCNLDTMRLDEGSRTGWRCPECAELLLVTAANKALWGETRHADWDILSAADMDDFRSAWGL